MMQQIVNKEKDGCFDNSEEGKELWKGIQANIPIQTGIFQGV